eukprot:scaffold33280_cov154-Skeletonema_menzelii.AAC.3
MRPCYMILLGHALPFITTALNDPDIDKVYVDSNFHAAFLCRSRLKDRAVCREEQPGRASSQLAGNGLTLTLTSIDKNERVFVIMTTPRRQHNHNTGSDKWSRRTTSSTTNSGEESVSASADLSHCKTSKSSSNLRRAKNNNERRPQRPSISTTIGSSSSAGAAAGGGAGSPHKNSTAATVTVGYSNQQQRQRPLDTTPPNDARPTAAVVRHACNNKGQCIYHPHIQLRKKTIMGVLGGWKDIRRVCPECVREDIIREFMRREAKEIERMEWILDEMERLKVVETSLNDDDDADNMTTAVDREDETGDDDRVKVVGDV